MPLQPTSLTLTPTGVNKGLTVFGSAPAVREKVALRVVGAATAEGEPPEGFVVRIVPVGHPCAIYPPWHPGVASVPAAPEYARFPLAATDAWVVDGNDLTAILKLDTVALEAAFGGTPIDSQIEARIVLESGSADNLYAVGRVVLRNWPQDGEDPVAGSSALKVRVDALETDLAAETEARAAADTDEIAARQAGDAALAGQLAVKATTADLLQEVADRTAAVQTETAARIAADAVLANGLADKAEATTLAAEASARAAADATEAGVRSAVDAELQAAVNLRATVTQLSTEIAARAAGDIALQAQIDTKQGSPTAGALAAVAALTPLPEEYTEDDVRAAHNALVAAVKGLYQ